MVISDAHKTQIPVSGRKIKFGNKTSTSMPLVIYDENDSTIATPSIAIGEYSDEIDVSQYEYISIKRNTSLSGFTTMKYIFTA